MEMIEESGLSPEEITTLDNRRLDSLADAGIDEHEIIGNARENINQWHGYFNENFTRGKDDANFLLRDQWTAVERSEFTRLFKPGMTFNKLYDPFKKIIGEQRNNKPDLITRSLTGHASQEEINLRMDLLRTICYQSQNDLVYQCAFSHALSMGFGAFQIGIEYETPKSFEQVIRYKTIQDPTQAAFDPRALKPHKGDGNFCSRNYILSREEFAATFPYVENPMSFSDPRHLLDLQYETKDQILICDYYVKEWFPTMIYKLSNGMVVSPKEWKELQKTFKVQKELARDSQVIGELILKEIPHIVMERQTQDYKIMHYRLLQNQVIDFAEWPSKNLPIIFVDGDSNYIEGRQYTRSFIHEAKDAQRFLNYAGSEIAAEIKNRRREQWIGTPDNILGNEQIWRNPELQNGTLIAKPDPKTGQLPQKVNPWDMSPALMANFQRAGQDIREILGFSEAQELQGRDVSGTARRERKLEGSMSAGVYFDNLSQAIEQGGRVVSDLLPLVYGGEERQITLTKPNGKTKPFIINQRMPDGSVENEILPGDFDVEIDAGPSFAVQKETALEMFSDTLKVFPQAFPLIADLWAQNLDLQQMPTIAERFKTLVPPEVIAKEEGTPPPPPKPNPQEQMMQMQMQAEQQKMQMNQQKMQIEQQQLGERAQELQIRQAKHKLEEAELILKAHEMKIKMHGEDERSRADYQKAELDYTTKMAAILADLHKHHNPQNSTGYE